LLTLIILFCYFTQGYYGIHSNPEFAIWKIIGYIAQLSIYLLIFIVAALLLIKDKWNLTKIIFAVSSALIAWILIRFCHVPYDSLYLTVALIATSFIQIASKSKFEMPASLALITIIIQPTISTIRTIIRNNDFLSLDYDDFYLMVSLFLILMLLQKHIVFNKSKKGD
ncbi:MAG: hypothetical protein J6V09_00785, partial [Clostridia bacterium]|nr:hypothetical protein [Clostridia bacterium]